MTQYYRYTNIRCRECKGQVVQDIWKLEYYCIECGLIHEEDMDTNDYDL